MKLPKIINKYEDQYRFLSNFYPCSIEMKFGNETYVTRSVEHAYQMSKFEVCSAPFLEIFYTTSAGAVKKIADANKHLVLDGFHDKKYQLMAELLERKFVYGSGLADLLVITGIAYLEEGNTWGDIFWGVCNGKGDNNLGCLQMQLREALYQRMKFDFMKVNSGGWAKANSLSGYNLWKLSDVDFRNMICELLCGRPDHQSLLEALCIDTKE